MALDCFKEDVASLGSICGIDGKTIDPMCKQVASVDPDQLVYRAEGNGHMVLAIPGSGQVLRCRPVNNVSQALDYFIQTWNPLLGLP